MKQVIIGLVGFKGSGKTTVAQELMQNWEFHSRAFADPIREMLSALGVPYHLMDGPQKEEPQAILGGKSPRWAMQTLGTEWGRQLIYHDLWINLWWQRSQGLPRVVVPDVRFPNEVEQVHKRGGKIWRIDRLKPLSEEGADPVDHHQSEANVNLLDADLVIQNHEGERDAFLRSVVERLKDELSA
jgi:hypothetical protein